MKDNKKIKTFEQHQEKMNKKELRKLDKYQNEINLANDRIISAGFTIYGDLYINCEKSFSEDDCEIIIKFKDEKNRHFHAIRYKTGWAIQIEKSCRYANGANNFDKFVFSDKVYYAFPGGYGGSDTFKKASFDTAFNLFLSKFEEAYQKILTEVLTVKWTKGIGNHSHTYPSGEGTFYVNAIVK